MKRLIVVLILVGLLTLPTMGLAEGKANPPKPGTFSNPGLWTAYMKGVELGLPHLWCYWGISVVDWLLCEGAPPWFAGK